MKSCEFMFIFLLLTCHLSLPAVGLNIILSKANLPYVCKTAVTYIECLYYKSIDIVERDAFDDFARTATIINLPWNNIITLDAALFAQMENIAQIAEIESNRLD